MDFAAWKKHAKLAGGVATVLATIAGGVIAVESRYAHADDVKQILTNTNQVVNLYQRAQRQNQLFQIDYYGDRLKQLEDEKRRAQVIHSSSSTSATTKAITRTPSDVSVEIEDVKKRKDFAEKSLIGN